MAIRWSWRAPEQHIQGAEYFRMGQEDILGRYPIHWHMLGDAEGQYVEDVSIHHTYQKGITIHGTSKIRVEEVSIFDHVGHGVFFEDGSENGNLIIGNLVFNTRSSATGEPIPTDKSHASSYWIENPNNIVLDNHAAGGIGAETNGFWIIPAPTPHGLSADTFVGEAGNMADLIFSGNTAHSSKNGLGVEGFLRSQLQFSTRIIESEFAVIDDFTAYNNQNVGIWAVAYDLVIQDSALVDNDFGLWLRGNDIVLDTLNADTDANDDLDGTVRLYRDGGTQIDGLHLDGVDGLGTQWTDHQFNPECGQQSHVQGR